MPDHRLDHAPFMVRGRHRTDRAASFEGRGPVDPLCAEQILFPLNQRYQGKPVFSMALDGEGPLNGVSPLIRRVLCNNDLHVMLIHEISAKMHHARAAGIAVMLHAAGDFWSEVYVRNWLNYVDTYPNLLIYGSTQRPLQSAIGELISLGNSRPDGRFAIAFPTLQ